MKYRRMPIEIESPEQLGYDTIQCNLAESSVSDLHFRDLGLNLDDVVLAYGNHYGKPELRALIAQDYDGITAEDVLVTAGAANALFIVSTALLSKSDRLVVQFPNYATNLETPFGIGCEIVQVELKFENQFRLDMEELERSVNASTKLISVTTPHNPTGTSLTLQELQQLVAIAESNKCILLVDETYRDLVYGEQPPLAATLSENVISVSSLSKATGLPGIRIGWIISRNKNLYETFLAAKEQIVISNSVLDEEVALHYMKTKSIRTAQTRKHVQHNFQVMKNWMEGNPLLEWVEPTGGVVCYPRFRTDRSDYTGFYNRLLNERSTLVGRGQWFGMSDRYMRIGFGWPDAAQLQQGLKNISDAASL